MPPRAVRCHIVTREADADRRVLTLDVIPRGAIEPLTIEVDFAWVLKHAADIMGVDSSAKLMTGGLDPAETAINCMLRGTAEILHMQADAEMVAIEAVGQGGLSDAHGSPLRRGPR